MKAQVFKNPIGEHIPSQGRQLKKVRRYMPPPVEGLRGPFFRPEYAASNWFFDSMHILATVERKDDEREWYHVSVRIQGEDEPRLPTYGEMAQIRDLMFKESATVVQVFPPRSEHVSDHDYVLHLWSRMGKGRILPDLRGLDDIGNLSI